MYANGIIIRSNGCNLLTLKFSHQPNEVGGIQK